MKQFLNKKHVKSNCIPVIKEVRKLWDKGCSVRNIATQLRTAPSVIEKITLNWKIRRNGAAPARKRKFDYHVAYCLVFEHGMTYKQAAFALSVTEEINPRSVAEILRRNKKLIEETHESWKISYARERRLMLKGNSRKRTKSPVNKKSIARNVVWDERFTEETKTKLVENMQRKGTCPHCGIIASAANLKRFHFDNCKQRQMPMAAE